MARMNSNAKTIEIQDNRIIAVIDRKLMSNIEMLYYINSPSKKMLKDMGIYERDIDYIIEVIGDDFDSVEELRQRINAQRHRLVDISVISRYVVERFID